MKKVKVLDYAKVQTIGMMFLGLLAGILYSFGGLIIDLLVTLGWITSTETPGLSYGTALAFLALLGMPLIFGVFGFVTGLIGAFLYNIASKWFGEAEISIKK